MEILHLGKFYSPYKGGMETVLENLCKGQRDFGHQIKVICASEDSHTKSQIIENIDVLKSSSIGSLFSQPLSPSLPFQILEAAQTADVINIHSPHPLIEMTSLLLPKNIPIVVTYHSDIVRQKKLLRLYDPLLKAFLKRANCIVAPTNNSVKYSRILPQFESKCSVVPYGIDQSKYDYNEKISSLEAKLKNQYGDFLLFVGRLVSYKGIEVLIKALSETRHKAVIIGTGPLKQELINLCEQLNIADRIHFVGEVPSHELLMAHYYACNFVVLPSITTNESFGMVQIEAMHCRKAVITTNLKSGVPQVGIPNETVEIVSPGNVNELRESINKFFVQPLLCQQYGEKGKTRALERYTIESMAKSYMEIYENIINQSAKYKTEKAA